MLSLEECKEILREEESGLPSDEEIAHIREDLQTLAELLIEVFEKDRNNGSAAMSPFKTDRVNETYHEV